MPDIPTIRNRRDFLAAARSGSKSVADGIVLQVRDRGDGGAPRFGVTATRKIGDSVARNRAKRRLRALARSVLPEHGRPGHDYVLIARHDTNERPWAEMRAACGRLLADGKAAPTKPKPASR